MAKRKSAAHSLPAATKQQKVEAPRYHCQICKDEKLARAFPDYNPSPDCVTHNINTCKVCLKGWVESRIKGSEYVADEDGAFGIHCPECGAVMRAVNIEMTKPSKDIYQQYEKARRHHIHDNTPGWRWCLNPDCEEGQVHSSKPSPAENERPKRSTRKRDNTIETKQKTEPNICICHKCGEKACVTCDRPYHEGEDCEQYQLRIRDRLDEEDSTLKTLKTVSKSCPGCARRVQKDGGCNRMFCKACSTYFCWGCNTVFAEGDCKCLPQPRGRLPALPLPRWPDVD